MPVIILGGIYGGIFTPTEASAVAVFYALIVGMVIYREIKLPTCHHPAQVGVVQRGDHVHHRQCRAVCLPDHACRRARCHRPLVGGCAEVPAYFLLGVNAALFLIGMFIETSAAIIVLAPILAPVAMHFGIDPVHFGLIMVVNLALGMITPPFGVNLFAACTVARISLDRMIKDLIPFVLVILACLMVITYVPGLSLGLRDLVYAR
jgi:C4-dicarboxylate transporter DctM subunit